MVKKSDFVKFETVFGDFLKTFWVRTRDTRDHSPFLKLPPIAINCKEKYTIGCILEALKTFEPFLQIHFLSI